MKTLIPRKSPPECHCFDFSFPALDTFVRLEKDNEGIIIRATGDSFSPIRKRSFIDELAAEGFIDDSYHWFSGFEGSVSRIQWLIDDSWLRPDQISRTQTNRFMIRLLLGATAFWLALLTLVFLLAR